MSKDESIFVALEVCSKHSRSIQRCSCRYNETKICKNNSDTKSKTHSKVIARVRYHTR